MGFRFRKSFALFPGLKINLSKSGPSLSVGEAGASYNIGAKGERATVGLPGSGMSYSTFESGKTGRASTGKRLLLWVGLTIALAIAVHKNWSTISALWASLSQ
jgi:hypothetical protein